jgi:hypothetical protein
VGFLDLRLRRREKVYAAASIGGASRLADRVVDGGRPVRVHDSSQYAVCQLRRADDRAPLGAPITLRVESAEASQRTEDEDGVCAFIRPNGRRCVNAAEPGSAFCGLPAHQGG